MFLTDRVSVGKTRRTADGYLVADAKVARTGIQEYAGSELGRDDMKVVRVYRPEAEVFHADTMRSFAHRPMTNDHPAKMVTADTWRAVAVGLTGEDVVRDGDFVRVPLVLMDASAIKAFESGKRELSMGYTAEIVFEGGVTPDGQQYDAIQTQIRNNHLALVDRARGGDQLRIGDDIHNQKEIPMNLKTILVDGLSVETTDAGAQAIAKLQAQVQDGQTALATAQAAHATALATKDAEIAKRDATIDDLKGKELTDAQLDERVNARADLIADANLVAKGDYAGLSDSDIRKKAVATKLGDAAVKDKADAYVQARFDIAVEDAKKDPVRKALGDSTRSVSAVNDNGYGASVENLDYRTRGQKKEG